MLETLVVALVAIALVLWVRPGTGLGILIASSLLWPEYARLPVGVVQLSAPRIVALLLIARHIGRWSRLQKHPCDWLVVAGYLLSVVSVIAAASDSRFITTTIGRGLDTVVIYFAARLCLANYEDVKSMRWPLAMTAFAVGSMSMFEALTQTQLFRGAYVAAGNELAEIGQGRGGVGQTRWGMLRSQVSTLHPIYFGVAMTIVTGLMLAMRHSLSKWTWFSAVVASSAAVFFCLSSGPWTAGLLLLLILPLCRTTWLIKPAIGGLVLVCLMFELLSNRHFYHVICYIGLSNSTAWYRVRLLEVAFEYLPEYWMFGYGGRSFDHWGYRIDARYFIDCVNNYVYIAATTGVPTMLCYLLAKIAVVWAVAKRWKRLGHEQRWVAFAFIATVLAIALAECSVSVFGPALILNSLILGAGASVCGWSRVGATSEQFARGVSRAADGARGSRAGVLGQRRLERFGRVAGDTT
ncbi:MAG: hypothetical protein SGJ11_00970 [Phycisphaerae bacterium]|nr:hypothetical protein [Phycisphaerae bacterium]